MSNDWQLQCLCNRLFRRTSEKHQRSASLFIVRGILQWLEHYPHKGPVTQKIFLCYDIMMWTVQLTYTRSHLGILLKIHVHGFFATDIQEVSWHIDSHEVFGPCDVLRSTDSLKIGVKQSILKWVLILSYTDKSHAKLPCIHVWRLGFPTGFQHGWMWFGNTMTRLGFVPFKSLAKCTMTTWTLGGNQWDSFLVQLRC